MGKNALASREFDSLVNFFEDASTFKPLSLSGVMRALVAFVLAHFADLSNHLFILLIKRTEIAHRSAIFYTARVFFKISLDKSYQRDSSTKFRQNVERIVVFRTFPTSRRVFQTI